MSKLYGWGASVVIIGALFKINHYPGADTMLIIGLGTESLIFFFSAFEPPHADPDWSLVYPELAGLTGSDHVQKVKIVDSHVGGGSGTQELDRMLEKAKIGQELIDSLGNGLRSLNETTSQLAKISNVAAANEQYVQNLKGASESVSALSESYKKTAASFDQNVAANEDQLKNMQAVSKTASSLSVAYASATESLKEDISTTLEFVNSMKNATTTANQLITQYSQSAAMLSKSAETLNTSSVEGENYNKQLQKISSN
ncbi:MAG: gliding motility protein GldL, partial [Bacteroidota bacterium]